MASQKLNGIETTTIIGTTSAPIWMPYLQSFNAILTTISLLIGICFAIWTWRRSAKKEYESEHLPHSVHSDDYPPGK